MNDDGKLLDRYHEAWAEFEACVQKLQAARADGSRDRLNQLFHEVESARLKYSSARDRLVSRMLTPEVLGREPRSDDARIRGAAQLLWEFEGRPGNSAEKDWLCAEAMVRRAAAGG
jgi:hypothetical protein